MGNKDDLPTDAMPIDKMLTRQDKVLRFLTDAQSDFLRRLQTKNPITAYRFGSVVDEAARENVSAVDDWKDWLKPDPRVAIPDELGDEEKQRIRKQAELYALLVNGTNLGDSLLSVINRESNNMLQGIIVVSDGRSTAFSTQTFEEIRARANKSQVPIFAVGIGDYREPINIRITDLQTPDSARPDDRFPIRVEIDGDGKADQTVNVRLDIYKPDAEQPSHTMEGQAKFKPGEPPHAQVEFQIDPAALPDDLKAPDPSSGKPELLEGKWKFVVRVDKDSREVFLPKEHVSDPEYVNVLKKPLRVFLFAGGPSREYQFLRTLLVREMDQKRAEVSIFLQNAKPDIVQDVPNERLLRDFPNAIRDVNDPTEKPDDKFYNLMQYDVVLAFDPDWTKLESAQLELLETWVQRHDGGLIFIAGPVNTFQLARGVNLESKAAAHNLARAAQDNASRRSIVHDRSLAAEFSGAAGMEFSSSTKKARSLSAGTNFHRPQGWRRANPGAHDAAFRFLPGPRRQDQRHVVATFTDPPRMRNNNEQPFLAFTLRRRQRVYVGSGETWRRQCHESFHERF